MQCCWKCWRYLVSKRCMQLHLGKCAETTFETNQVVATNGRCLLQICGNQVREQHCTAWIILLASWKHHNNMFKQGEAWLPECTRRLAILHEIIRLFCQRAVRSDRLRRLSFPTMPGWLALRKQCSWRHGLKQDRLAQQLQVCAQTFFWYSKFQRQEASDRDDRIWKSYNEFMSDPILPRWSHPHPCGWSEGCVDQKPASLQLQK